MTIWMTLSPKKTLSVSKNSLKLPVNMFQIYAPTFPKIGMTQMPGFHLPKFMRKNKSELISFANAVYCYEELIMLNPAKFELFAKLGEMHFTVGKLESLILARKYFSFVLTINGLAVRPLFGLMRTCEMLKSLEKNEINQKIIDIIAVKLKNIYGKGKVAESLKGTF